VLEMILSEIKKE
jgi:hypothetical protein